MAPPLSTSGRTLPERLHGYPTPLNTPRQSKDFLRNRRRVIIARGQGFHCTASAQKNEF